MRRVTAQRHLILQEKELNPSSEWQPRANGWLGLRVAVGQGYWLQNGAPVRSLGAGDVLFINESVNGALRASQLGPLKVQYFTVSLPMLTGVLTLAESHQFEIARQNPDLPVMAFSAKDSVGQKFTATAQLDPEQLAARCACLQLWAEAYASLVAAMPVVGETGDKLSGRFRHLIGQIPQAELATHSLTDLAAQLHCSERHFSRLFREQFGGSLRSRQIEMRLERARQLLGNSNAKIINVAYESGYRHVGLFNAMFKKRFGMTPSEWRRQNLKKNVQTRPRHSRQSASRLVARLAVVLLFCLSIGQLRLGCSGLAIDDGNALPLTITTETVVV